MTMARLLDATAAAVLLLALPVVGCLPALAESVQWKITTQGFGPVRAGMTVREASADRNFRIVFETDGRHVTSIRAGRLPEVGYTEGCS